MDLLALVVGCMGPRDRAAFASASSFHLLVLRMVGERPQLQQQQPGDRRAFVDAAVTAARATPLSHWRLDKAPPFGLGCVDRPRFLQPGERPDTVVRASRLTSRIPFSPHQESDQSPSSFPSLNQQALVSYPRSGNSMLRGLLERVTGVVTGSDTRPDRVLSRSLLRKGLRGEGVVDDRAWVVKTHWPERCGYRRFPAHRVILLVRNPFDAVSSYFNMGLTNTHEQTLADVSQPRAN